MAALDNYALATDPEFRKKVRLIMLKVALDVSGEDNSGKTDTFIQKRANSANFTIYNQDKAIDVLSYLICAQGTLISQNEDSDIEYMLTQVWDSYSGILFTEKTN